LVSILYGYHKMNSTFRTPYRIDNKMYD